MAFKTQIQPLCRCCGVAIKKRTTTLSVCIEPPRTHAPETKHGTADNKFERVPTGNMVPMHVPDHVVGRARTRDEAQRLTNKQVVSIRKGRDGMIHTIGIWDGESYEDEFFCTGTCAMAYARMVLKHPENKIQSVAYMDAIHFQKTGKHRE